MSASSSTTRNGSSKRRRKTDHPNTIASIHHLSNDNLTAIADFLPKTSRALLAVAFTASISSWRERGWERWDGEPNGTSKLLISSAKPSAPFSSLIRGLCREDELGGDRRRLRVRVGVSRYNEAFEASLEQQLREYYEGRWEILDFVDIGSNLASRLTDDDIGAILACIDAENNLKRLNLAHCFNIVGHGLNPLRRSTTIEKIDMGLVRKFEAPEMFSSAKISQEVVFDILDSILSMRENSLRRLQVPMKWWEWSNNDVIPGEGLVRFTGERNHCFLNKRSICCYFGYTGSAKDFLDQMRADRDPGQDLVDTCIDCASCHYFEACVDCNKIVCSECECNYIRSCQFCGVKSCNECMEWDENTVSFCANTNCGCCLCNKCRLNECREGTNNCDGCRSLAFDKLLEENEVLRRDLEELRL